MADDKKSNLILPFQKPKKHGYLEDEHEEEGTEEIKKSKSFLIQAAHLHCPENFGVTGFAAVFYFQLRAEDSRTYSFACQTNFGQMHEGQADMGIKKLAEHSMQKFGRTVPKKRN